MGTNPYESPPSLEEELPIGLAPADALERHKAEFSRQVARQRLGLRLVGIVLAILAGLAIILPLLYAPAILVK
jgi:hypothetical protein